jgi:hypothetical protein
MKLTPVVGALCATIVLTSCVPTYTSPPASANTAQLFMGGEPGYTLATHIYRNAQTCEGREWVSGGVAGPPKWINVAGDQPVTISIDVGDVYGVCPAIGTFVPEMGKRYIAHAILRGGIQRCGLAVNEVTPSGSTGAVVPVKQRKFKTGIAESSPWCMAEEQR